MQRLLFFPDYSADPVWELPSECMVDLDSLPISDALRDAIRFWASDWEKLTYQHMDADDVAAAGQRGGAAVGDQEWAEIDRRGRQLWLGLQRELPGDFVIGRAEFNGVSVRHAQWVQDGPLEPCPPIEQ